MSSQQDEQGSKAPKTTRAGRPIIQTNKDLSPASNKQKTRSQSQPEPVRNSKKPDSQEQAITSNTSPELERIRKEFDDALRGLDVQKAAIQHMQENVIGRLSNFEQSLDSKVAALVEEKTERK
ncbi:hypothetical protein MMC16_007897, partial [Acarospora aff. strigata]|nr:hypothetical protein [Acarospora aff. strigata]